MNKRELIGRMANKTGMAKKDCGIALDNLLSTVTEARTGRNPQTKEVVEISAQSVPVFKAGKALKESILGNEKR